MRARTIARSQVAAALIGLLLVSLLVVRTSTAAFTGTTSNGTNTWGAGTIAVTDDDAGSAMFTAPQLRPNESGTRCIQVTYTGSMGPTAVVLYTTGFTATDGSAGGANDGALLADHLDLVIDYDTSTTGTFAGGCGDFIAESTVFTGTLATLRTAHTDYGNGIKLNPGSTNWNPSPGTSRVFRVRYTLNTNAPNTVQGDTASANLVWEAKS